MCTGSHVHTLGQTVTCDCVTCVSEDTRSLTKIAGIIARLHLREIQMVRHTHYQASAQKPRGIKRAINLIRQQIYVL